MRVVWYDLLIVLLRFAAAGVADVVARRDAPLRTAHDASRGVSLGPAATTDRPIDLSGGIAVLI